VVSWRTQVIRFEFKRTNRKALALFFASQTWLSYKYSGGQASFWRVLKISLTD